MPFIFTLIDLDGLDAIDPVTILVIMILLFGLAVAIGAVAVANIVDRKRGRA